MRILRADRGSVRRVQAAGARARYAPLRAADDRAALLALAASLLATVAAALSVLILPV